MQNRELIDRLTRLAEKQEGVLWVVISGSIARGDVWEGSDVDLHVLWESRWSRSILRLILSIKESLVMVRRLCERVIRRLLSL